MPVTNNSGTVLIQCSGPDKAQSTVTMKDKDTLDVVSEGKTYDFPAAQVAAINYAGTLGGGDTLSSQVHYTLQVFTFAGGNHITGGTGVNLVYLKGDNNVYDGGANPSLVCTYGKGNTLNGTNLYHIAY